MEARQTRQDEVIPQGKVLKPAATGKEREKAIREMKEVSQRAGVRAREMGLLNDEDVERFVNEP